MLDIYERLKRETGLLIGIADADLLDHGTRHPNLALLKISAFCKAHGHTVELMADYDGIEQYDVVFLSCVFSFTALREEILDLPYVYYGGTGIFPDGGENLPDEVEHMCPDYSLYEPYVESQLALGRRRSALSDYLDYSIGFTTENAASASTKSTTMLFPMLRCRSSWMRAAHTSIFGTITSWHIQNGRACSTNLRQRASRFSLDRVLMSA